VVGLVIGGIWGVASSVRASMQSNHLHQQTLNLVSSIRDYYANRPLPAVAGAITTTLQTKGRFPEEMCPANCVAAAIPGIIIRNAYGGSTMVTVPNPATYSNQFYITYLSVDKKGCMELGMKLSARAPEIGLVSYLASGGSTRTTFPIPLTTLQSDCVPDLISQTLNVIIYFKIRT